MIDALKEACSHLEFDTMYLKPVDLSWQGSPYTMEKSGTRKKTSKLAGKLFQESTIAGIREDVLKSIRTL